MLIHDGMLHCEETASDTGRLTHIAELFGDALPKDYRGRSVAPSDVIELYDDTGRRYFYRDTDGFCPVKFSPMLAKKLEQPEKAICQEWETAGVTLLCVPIFIGGTFYEC